MAEPTSGDPIEIYRRILASFVEELHRGFLALIDVSLPEYQVGKIPDDVQDWIGLANDSLQEANLSDESSYRQMEDCIRLMEKIHRGNDELAALHRSQFICSITQPAFRASPSLWHFCPHDLVHSNPFGYGAAALTRSRQLWVDRPIGNWRLISVRFPLDVGIIVDDLLESVGMGVSMIPYIYEHFAERTYGMVVDDGSLDIIKANLVRLGCSVDAHYATSMSERDLERFLAVAPDAVTDGWGDGPAECVRNVARIRLSNPQLENSLLRESIASGVIVMDPEAMDRST